ncbi:MAG: MBL fold metallo-hydrolase [Colwelliaceae bacterium]|jgi:glyoxylase-like metal-dependent hydrolase (beta-lactamase superfamily II)|nr:MBL fold metallo-hydrolase [Colwelliaceae bacterium]
MSPLVKHFFDHNTSTFTYVVFDEQKRVGVIIDPVLDFDVSSGKVAYQSADKLLAFINKEQLSIEWILETHAHADHLSSAQYLKSKTFAKIAIGIGITRVQETFKRVFDFPESFATDGSQFDHCFSNDEVFMMGNFEVKVLSTPGHTNDSVTYLIGDTAFIGDTLFHPSLGTARCDFPGGDSHMLYQSIQKILSLPEQTRLFLCHDYPENERVPIFQISIAEQRAKNIHINDNFSEKDFITFRQNRDKQLAVPKLLYPAVQVNIAAGNFPESENNQQVYLKLPVKLEQSK